MQDKRFFVPDKAMANDHISPETKIVKGQSVILGFQQEDKVRINIPFINLKHGAGNEYPNNATGTVKKTFVLEKLVEVTLDRPWKGSQQIFIPASFLERA